MRILAAMNPITYCMNVHPGETLESVFDALKTVTLPLRDALLGAEREFAIGLRLGHLAAEALRSPGQFRRLSSFLARNRLSVIGINGFPYGAFHDEMVKTAVYEPDWTARERIQYTCNLFYALTHFPLSRMGEHCASVTTVPLAYDRGQGFVPGMFQNLCEMALFLRKLEGFTGHRLCLALEPEPDCLLESTRTTIDFFEELWQYPEWNPAYRDYIGLCFDTCHFALGYEDPQNALREIVSANIPVERIQVSAALEVEPGISVDDLLPFLDLVYLHQTRRLEPNGVLCSFPDLTTEVIHELLNSSARIHYHVPLAWAGEGHLRSTRQTLTPGFWRYVRAGGWPVEVETYAFSVYPSSLRTCTLSEALFADIRWVQEQLSRV